MRETYLRFLSLAQTLNAASISTVDETARHLLQLIALRHAHGNALTVTEAMAMSTVASPATIHRKLDALREAGLIDQMFEGQNRRTKYLVPTAAADAYFAELGDVMSAAASRA